MSAPPIPCVYAGGVFTPLKRFHNIASASYGEGEIIPLVPHQERSRKSHDHYFVCVGQAFDTLPEDLAERFATEDHLRRYALIKTGFRNEAQIVCTSQAEAVRAAVVAKGLDPYCIAVPRDGVLTIYTANSQSLKAMGKERFQASKDAVLAFLAGLIGVSPETLTKQAA